MTATWAKHHSRRAERWGCDVKCPACTDPEREMSEVEGESHECENCGTLICITCDRVYTGAERIQLSAVETRTGYDYYCIECDSQVYGVDIWAE